MRDEINQNISRLIDGDLGYDETLDLLNKMQTDDDLKVKMARYHAISQALRNEEFFYVRPDFSDKIFQQIQREPAYLLPQRKPVKTNTVKFFAVAASVLVAAVLVGQNLQEHTVQANNNQFAQAKSLPRLSPPLTLAQKSRDTEIKQNRNPLTKQFNDYLQAHNSSVYTNGEANFHPYAKMAAFGRE